MVEFGFAFILVRKESLNRIFSFTMFDFLKHRKQNLT